jgi:hypothetical protein
MVAASAAMTPWRFRHKGVIGRRTICGLEATNKTQMLVAAPVTGAFRWVYRPDLTFIPEPCDPDNARRFLK